MRVETHGGQSGEVFTINKDLMREGSSGPNQKEDTRVVRLCAGPGQIERSRPIVILFKRTHNFSIRTSRWAQDK